LQAVAAARVSPCNHDPPARKSLKDRAPPV
jgi:hypothetical protein